MTDPISIHGRSARVDSAARGPAERREEPSGSEFAGSVAPARDEFVRSEAAQSMMRAEAFDREKVEAIKQAIREGNYPLDDRRIAESFFAIERLIG